MSPRSSTTVSISSMQYSLQELHMVAWGSGSTGHWAIFVPNSLGAPRGQLIHIGVQEKSSGTASIADPQLMIHGFRVTSSGADRSFQIVGARATLGQVEDAARHVHANYRYNFATKNFQTFAMDVLMRLNHLYPSNVTAEGISFLQNRGTVSMFLARIFNRPQVAYPQAGPPPSGGFVID
ncbi:hypothetical protein BDV26DRAFT_287829 [Aspergillus bertholletiae]|uniref:Uncharacterized protein n=1 Tax=Aspergillus bertholletiae TaxID=1226010 RepID=A0A5N7BN05_9EURO|nr:hypothetical protein BDV26DRAFT_287829 [Aspergillus bertholletiae]